MGVTPFRKEQMITPAVSRTSSSGLVDLGSVLTLP